jgi:hypothetical protein
MAKLRNLLGSTAVVHEELVDEAVGHQVVIPSRTVVIMYSNRPAVVKPSGDATVHELGPRSAHPASRIHQAPHVYRNPCTRTWICDHVGTRSKPGPDSARTIYRTQLDAVRAALGEGRAGGRPLSA